MMKLLSTTALFIFGKLLTILFGRTQIRYTWPTIQSKQNPPPPQPFYGPFSGTTRVSRCHKRTLWCKGRLTEADTPTIRLCATPSGLTSAHLHHPLISVQTEYKWNIWYSPKYNQLTHNGTTLVDRPYRVQRQE